MSEEITAWITRYALTEGIERVTGIVLPSEIGRPDMLKFRSDRRGAFAGDDYAHGNDWHRTPEAALARAEQMRQAKIASLRRSIERLEKLTFEAT